ncbi:MAG TPA: flagellar biosynthetic protein FliR [Sandaracinaceae bacterium LLY-WYZ-13_1]|nr:flagellar biosynthetic protein FliR [Sandaracinaceae bacterium LLY-WYZ-13_1]
MPPTEVLEELLGVPPARLATVFLLVLARTVPLAWIAPWLGWKGTAVPVRASVAVVLAAAFTPLAMGAAPPLPTGWLPLGLIGIREVLVGAAFAVAASLPLYALGWTGQLVDRWRGSPPDATASGPTGGDGPLGALHLSAAVVLFVLLGGHRLALAAFARGLVDVPPGAGGDAAALSAFALGAARLVTAALELTLAFAAPAVVAFLVLEAVIGLWGRVAPSVRLWMEGMSLRAMLGVAVALLGLVAILPRLGPVFVRSIERASALLEAVR